MYYEDLKLLMERKNISEKELAKRIGIDDAQLMRKLRGEAEFTLWEIKSVAEILSLTGRQVMLIFFTEKVS